MESNASETTTTNAVLSTNGEAAKSEALPKREFPVKIEGWRITSRQLDTIWNRVYNRIVALAWQSHKYYELFEASHEFRRLEFNRILGILKPAAFKHKMAKYRYKLHPKMAVCVRDSERRTDLLITPEGIVFPWPEMDKNPGEGKDENRPSLSKLKDAYQLGGGRLPNVNRTLHGKKSDELVDIQEWYVALLEENPLEGIGLDKSVEMSFVKEVLFQTSMSGVNEQLRQKEAEDLTPAQKKAFRKFWDQIDKIDPATAEYTVYEKTIDTETGKVSAISKDKVALKGHPGESETHCKAVEELAFLHDAFFIGEQFRMLVEQVPKIIARAWADATYQQEYLGNARNQKGELAKRGVRQRRQRDKLTDISLPRRIKTKASEEIKDVAIIVRKSSITNDRKKPGINWTLSLPYLPEPKRPDMFREMISGHASNPLYTNSYT